MARDDVEKWLLRQKYSKVDYDTVTNIAARARIDCSSLFYVGNPHDFRDPIEIFSLMHMEPARIEYDEDTGRPQHLAFTYLGELFHITPYDKDTVNRPMLQKLNRLIQARWRPTRDKGNLEIDTNDGQAAIDWARGVLKRKDSITSWSPFSAKSWSPFSSTSRSSPLDATTNMQSPRERDELPGGDGALDQTVESGGEPVTVRRRSSKAVILDTISTWGRQGRQSLGRKSINRGSQRGLGLGENAWQ